MTVILSSANELLDDLKFIFDTAKSPQGYTTLSSNLDVFLTGVDRAKPIVVRTFVTKGVFDRVISLPIANAKNLKEFLDNAGSLDVKSKVVPGKPNLYKLSKLFEGYLYFDGSYAHMGEKEGDVLALKGAPPASVLKGYDVVMVLNNDPKQLQDRKTAFATIRKEMLAGLKKKDKEADADFAIRKLAAEQQIEELERFFVEAAHISTGWTTSAKDKTGVLNFDMTAIPETSLAASIAGFDKTPDEFAGIDDKGSVASASINFPLDDLRKKHLADATKLSRPRVKEKINENTKLTDDQKKIDGDLSELVFDIIDGVGTAGVFNGFLRVYPHDKSAYTILGGVKVADTQKVVDVIQKLGEREGKDKVKINTEQVGEIQIHTLQVPEKIQAEYPEFFAKDATLYIGTSKTTVWYCVGDDALGRMKKAIEQAKTGAGTAKGAALDLHGRLFPWVDIADKRRGKVGEWQIRKMALDAFAAGEDTISVKLVREGDEVKLHLQINEGVFRFAGKVLAKFVKESLE